MLYGQITNGTVYLTNDKTGMAVYESPEPAAPPGYHTSLSYEKRDGRIYQVWAVGPDAGTPQDAALMLAQIQAAALGDDDALKVPALFPAYSAGRVYALGDRVLWQGALYKATSGHTATAGDPASDPQHWTKVLPTSTGVDAPEWVAGEAYPKGARVTKYGQVYESLVDGNELEPGTFGSDSAWSQVTAA